MPTPKARSGPPSTHCPSPGSALLAVALALAGCGTQAGTQPGGDGGVTPDLATSPDSGGGMANRCAVITDSIRAAGFDDKVTVQCDQQYAWIAGDTYPAHPKMNGITGTNDQVPVPAPGYRSPIALNPVKAAKYTSIDAALGVAVNGVPIYDYSSQGTLDPAVYDPKADTKLTGELDICGGHSGRGDDYHYHAAPTCMMEAMKNKGPAAIIGWGFDGYPIYGNANPDGTAIKPGELDTCNGKSDPTFGYRYHTSDSHPYIVQCLVGNVDLAIAPRVSPLQGQAGPGRPPGMKPPGGVQNLKLVEDPNGTRVMTYDWMGQTYSIQYKPAAARDCWDFEDKSYTSKGMLTKGTYCRVIK